MAWSASDCWSASAPRAAPPFEITVLCEEPRAAYDRVHLTSFFSGKTAQDLSLVEPGFFERNGINLHVCRSRRRALIASAARFAHRVEERSITTAWCWRPARIRSFLRYRDATGRVASSTARSRIWRRFAQAGALARTGVVIGGGLLGLEAAKALKDLGLDTHVVEFAPRLMAVQIDDPGGRVLHARIAELGVGVHTGKNTVEITDGTRHAQRIRFADGGELETDLIVFSAGIRPRDELARAAGLAVGERGGIVVDNDCRTSDPDIFAIGECALWNGRIFGLVAPGYQMAGAAAAHLMDRSDASFTGADMSTKLKLMGVDVASIGDAHAATAGCARLLAHRRATPDLQETGGQRRRKAAARCHPGRRRR